MKIRTIAAFLLLPFLVFVILFAPKMVAVVLAAIMAAISAYELLYNTKLVTHPRMLAYTMAFAFLVPFWSYFGCSYSWALAGLFLFYVLLFLELLIAQTKVAFSKAAACMAGGIVIPFLFSALIRLFAMGDGSLWDDGRLFLILPFLIAFLSDSGAYFVGVFFGKHKLCPNISPKKTVEGLVGGLIAAVLGMVIYGVILQFVFGFTVNYLYVVIYGLVGSLAGVFGDLSFSVIKRQTKIKDYGNLIPGHGGILDRFDSVIVVAPLVELLLMVIPVAVRGG